MEDKKLKRILSLLLCMALFVCAFSLVGCSNENNSGDNPQNSGQPGPGSEPEKNWNEDNALKVLTIGNSFSDDTMEYVYQIATDLGVEEVFLGNLYIGGCTLATHAANARSNMPMYEYRTNDSGLWHTERIYSIKRALQSQNWDFVSLQQASGSSGMQDTYGDLEYLLTYVTAYAPTADIVWNMTWAYEQTSSHSEFHKYDNDQLTMYNRIVSAVQNCVLTYSVVKKVIPCGTAIQNARTSYVGDRLTRDGYHLTLDLGRYIAGLTLVEALTGLEVKNVTFKPNGVSENYRKVAVDAVHKAVQNPFSVTNSLYPSY